MVQDFVEFRTGQGLNVRESRRETFEIRDHGGDLGLLKHDLGHPDAVRRPRALPGQIPATVLVPPGEQPSGESGILRVIGLCHGTLQRLSRTEYGC